MLRSSVAGRHQCLCVPFFSWTTNYDERTRSVRAICHILRLALVPMIQSITSTSTCEAFFAMLRLLLHAVMTNAMPSAPVSTNVFVSENDLNASWPGQMSTFCVTGHRKNADAAVAMLKRLIAEGNSEVFANNGVGPNANVNGGVSGNGNLNGIGLPNGTVYTDQRGPGVRGAGGVVELGQRLARMGSDLSRSDESPSTAPCR